MKATLFRCGTCGKRYTNPAAHTCVTRMGRKRPRRRTRVKPQVSRTCGTCGKPYASPLTHTCTVKTDFRQRKAAQARQVKREKAAKARRQKAALARQRKRDAAARARQRKREAAARARQRKRDAAKARQQAGPAVKPPGGGGTRQREAHDYRECFQASQPERGRAAQDCPRFPCRVYREGYQHGYAAGYGVGYAAGRAEGYAQGYAEGLASCPGPHGSR
jgi:hypothetical protein